MKLRRLAALLIVPVLVIACSDDGGDTTTATEAPATTGFADAASGQLPVWTPATTEAFATYGVIDSGAAEQCLVELEGHVMFRADGAEDLDRLGHGLRADAVAGEKQEIVGRHGSLPQDWFFGRHCRA